MKENNAASILKRPRWLQIAGFVVATLAVIYTLLGIFWSRTPDVFWVSHTVDDNRVVVGYATTDTLIRVAEIMLEKPGGYLSNDRMPPGIFLDNTPNWEAGVLQQVREIGIVKPGVEMNSDRGSGEHQTYYFDRLKDPDISHAFQVRRSEFDHLLLRNSANAGVEVHEGLRVTEVAFRSGAPSLAEAPGARRA